MSALRCALYLRVSTDGQTVENQRLQLDAYAARRGWEVVEVFEDSDVSGRKGRDARPGLDAMMKAAHQRRFDVLLVWELSRLSREKGEGARAYLRKLDHHGILWHSYTQEYLTTADHPLVRDILLAVMSWRDNDEAEQLSLRTKAGLERARAQGVKLGRPNKLDATVRLLRPLWNQLTLDGVAKRDTVATLRRRLARQGHKVSDRTIERAVAMLRKEGAASLSSAPASSIDVIEISIDDTPTALAAE